MVQCAVRGCTSRTDTVGVSSRMENAIHFHRVPKDPRLRKKWSEAINRSGIKNGTRVCSLHFRKENYYSTKLGLQKLALGSVPELKLQNPRYHDCSDDDDAMSNVEPTEETVDYQNQCQQSSPEEQHAENETTDNVPSALDEQPQQENNEDESEDEDEKMSEVETQDENAHLATNFQQNWEEKSTDSVSESSITKPGVQKYKVRTPLEKRLLKEVIRLKETGKQKMEAIHCLLEQNKRLLKRNSFLEKALEKSKKVAESANQVKEQETRFFKSVAANSNVSTHQLTIDD